MTCDHVMWTFCALDGLEAVNSGSEVLSCEQTKHPPHPGKQIHSLNPQKNPTKFASHFPGERQRGSERLTDLLRHTVELACSPTASPCQHVPWGNTGLDRQQDLRGDWEPQWLVGAPERRFRGEAHGVGALPPPGSAVCLALAVCPRAECPVLPSHSP